MDEAHAPSHLSDTAFEGTEQGPERAPGAGTRSRSSQGCGGRPEQGFSDFGDSRTSKGALSEMQTPILHPEVGTQRNWRVAVYNSAPLNDCDMGGGLYELCFKRHGLRSKLLSIK